MQYTVNMQSLIIASKNKKIVDDLIVKICQDNGIEDLDIVIIEHDKAIGIGEIRELQKRLFLKPLRGKFKAVILKNAQNLTLEAQNALLKVLEEPPPNTFIILTVAKKDLLLPTTTSRCKVIEIKEEAVHFSGQELTQALTTLETLLSSGVGERLKLAQDLGKNKDEALFWLEKIIMVARQELISHLLNDSKPNYQYTGILVSLEVLACLQQAHTSLSTTNVAPRFTLENLFLDF